MGVSLFAQAVPLQGALAVALLALGIGVGGLLFRSRIAEVFRERFRESLGHDVGPGAVMLLVVGASILVLAICLTAVAVIVYGSWR